MNVVRRDLSGWFTPLNSPPDWLMSSGPRWSAWLHWGNAGVNGGSTGRRRPRPRASREVFVSRVVSAGTAEIAVAAVARYRSGIGKTGGKHREIASPRRAGRRRAAAVSCAPFPVMRP